MGHGMHDLVVIGGGTAGLVCAAGAAGLGARVALVERHRLGGDCLYTGCVPSKTLIASARAGLDFQSAVARVTRAIATIAPHDSPERFRSLGVDVFLHEARFDGPASLVVDGRTLPFTRAVIATGARPRLPPITGLADAAPLTSETVFDLTTPPSRLAIIGGGSIGCELAHAFQRLGVAVTLLHDQPRLLDREDPEAAAIVERQLRRDGVTVVTQARIERVEPGAGVRTIVFADHGGPRAPADHEDPRRTDEGLRRVEVDAILVATGRQANVESLGLEAAGVARTPDGRVQVDDFLRTTNPRVYACGDVCLPWQFTHAADAAARIVVQNALFALGPLARRRVSALTMSWCTYTDPEVAQVGRADGDVYVQRFDSLDRAIADETTEGFVKVYTRPGTGTIIGATIAGPHAGDLIGEVAVAIAGRLSLGALAAVVHPYPTYAEAIRKCGDAYNRSRLTPQIRSVLAWWLRRAR
jgi:pyruvate/2-oxoglutarate dehydrogenase complex dihydrolipoamide dehydrogenase (E3) component